MTRTWLLCIALAVAGGQVAAQDAGTGHLYDYWWDADGDGLVGKAEFAQGWGKDEAGRFETLDRNGDGVVDREELEALDVDIDLADWDADNSGALNSQELQDGLFNAYDVDRDNAWSADEWQRAHDNPLLSGGSD